MKRLLITFVMILAISSSLMAVDVKEEGTSVIIKTTGYELHWNKAAQMGYMQVFVGGSKSIVGTADRAFYHSGEYGGAWHDWGALLKWEMVEKGGGKAVVKYVSNDGTSKEFTCIATYYDSVPYIKHEVTVKNVGNDTIQSFQSGHSPMFEVNTDVEGMQANAQPFPYTVYWVKDGYYGGLYGPDAQEAAFMAWGVRNPGRMHLVHDNQAKQLKKGDTSTIVYYVAFGIGKMKEAVALANDVQKEPSGGKAVSPQGSLSTTWGQIRSEY